jgi:hypothetical protein
MEILSFILCFTALSFLIKYGFSGVNAHMPTMRVPNTSVKASYMQEINYYTCEV